MRNIFFLAALFVCNYSLAQLYLEPFTGIAFDISNKQTFKYTTTGLQLSVPVKSNVEFALGFTKGFGFAKKSIDSSFTLNNSLPLYEPADKKIKPALYSIFLNSKLPLIKNNKGGLYLDFLIGYSGQRISVNYNYNQKEYVILNPESSISGFGFFTGGGLEYLFNLRTGRLFIQTNLISKPFTGKSSAFNSFTYAVPFSLNIGYSYNLMKKK
jgi:hypothetical protein